MGSYSRCFAEWMHLYGILDESLVCGSRARRSEVKTSSNRLRYIDKQTQADASQCVSRAGGHKRQSLE